MDTSYTYYREVFRGRPMPFAFVDLDRFDANAARILERSKGRNLCIATKSVRCPALIRRIQAHSLQFQALMAFCIREAVFLAAEGFDNILVAYPAWHDAARADVLELLRNGRSITLMIDAVEHVEHLQALGAEHEVTYSVCIDIDMSSSFPGIHFGVRRSPIRTPEQALAIWRAIEQSPNVNLVGVMGYEGQIAGLQDRVPGAYLRNMLIRTLKRRSIREGAERRGAIVQALRDAGAELRFVNGGGTGSIESTIQEDVVTEVTVGSGFYCPGLFDYYSNFSHQAAAGYAIEIVRQPTDAIYTCAGGGYPASGAAASDKLPQPYLPRGATLIDQEGAGEVQTPIVYSGPVSLSLGDPVFMRHAKAGELCERFSTLLLVSDGAVVDEVPTYRGQGQCFL